MEDGKERAIQLSEFKQLYEEMEQLRRKFNEEPRLGRAGTPEANRMFAIAHRLRNLLRVLQISDKDLKGLGIPEKADGFDRYLSDEIG